MEREVIFDIDDFQYELIFFKGSTEGATLLQLEKNEGTNGDNSKSVSTRVTLRVRSPYFAATKDFGNKVLLLIITHPPMRCCYNRSVRLLVSAYLPLVLLEFNCAASNGFLHHFEQPRDEAEQINDSHVDSSTPVLTVTREVTNAVGDFDKAGQCMRRQNHFDFHIYSRLC